MPPHDALTQGLVVSGFADLPSGVAMFLEFDWTENRPLERVTPGKGAWLGMLNDVAPISDADGKDTRAAALAFTWTGLQKIGLGDDALATFSAPFREGMYQEDRLRRLGDRVKEQWQATVIKEGPRWSANTPVRKDDASRVPWDGPKEPDELQVTTPKTVHALLLLYEKDEVTAKSWAAEVAARLTPHKVTVVHQLPLDLRLDGNNVAREHFGFADGLSQPIPYYEKSGDENAPDNLILTNGQPVTRDKFHGVPLGEILLGHTNAHHEKAPGPMVPDDQKGAPIGSTDGRRT